MKNPHVLALVALSLCLSSYAQPGADKPSGPSKAGAPPSEASEEPEMEVPSLRFGTDIGFQMKIDDLISRDSGNGGGTIRDPFWPVGYTPEGDVVVEAVVEEEPQVGASATLTPEQMEIIKEKLKITGMIKRKNMMVALVNNQIVGIGEVVNIQFEGRIYQFKVNGFKEGQLVVDTNWQPGAEE